MKAHFQNFILFLSTIFLFTCHSLPSIPDYGDPSGPGTYFDPANMYWKTAEIPQALTRPWYVEGNLHLLVTEDTLRIKGGFLVELEEFAKSGAYYRVIYKVGSDYHAAYIRNIIEESVQITYSDSSSSDISGIAALPVSPAWLTLSESNPWLQTTWPSNANGKWRDWLGRQTIIIGNEDVAVNQDVWQINAVQTNGKYNRFVLQRGNEYRAIYFLTIDENSMKVIITDGIDDIQDKYCNLEGERKDFYRYIDLLEVLPLTSGSCWNYNYTYQDKYYNIYTDETSQDSIMHTSTRHMQGQMNLEVLENTIEEGLSGEIKLLTTFQLDIDSSRTTVYRKTGEESELVYDSVLSVTGAVKTEQHEIILENDTLWYRTTEGKSYFALKKYLLTDQSPSWYINIRMAVYPFDFPRKGFNNGKDVTGILQVNQQINLNCPTIRRDEIQQPLKTYSVSAIVASKKGFECLGYFNANRNMLDKPYLNIPAGPYFEDTYFMCKLNSYTLAF